MEITTERLILRFIRSSDLESIHNLHSHPETDQYNTLGIPASPEETQLIMESWMAAMTEDPIKNYTFSILQKTSHKFIGLLGFKIAETKFQSGEAWYKIHSDHWSHGYATEALKALIDFGFRGLGLHRIEAGCAVDNLGSIRVLEKVGMTQEGRSRQLLPLKTGWSDSYRFAMLSTDSGSLKT